MSTRREFIGQLIAAGPTRTMSGAGGYVVTAAAIREAIDAGLFRGLACFVDHAASPSVRRLVGVWHDVTWREDGNELADGSGRAVGGVGGAAGMAVGRLRVYETDETRPVVALLEQTLVEAEPPDVGISLVFYPRLAADGRTITRIEMIESADVVMFPASAGSRIVSAGEREGGGAGAQGRKGPGEHVGAWRPGERLSGHSGIVSRSPGSGTEAEQGGGGEREPGSGKHKVGDASHNQTVNSTAPAGNHRVLKPARLPLSTLSRLRSGLVAQAFLPAMGDDVAQAFLPAMDDDVAQAFLPAMGDADGRYRDGLKPVADTQSTLKRAAAGSSGSAFQRTWRGRGGFQSAAATGVGGGDVMFASAPAAGRNACATNDWQTQETGEMTQQNETTELRRVALVAGMNRPEPVGEGEKGRKGEGEPAGGVAFDGWLEALRTAAATAVIRASGLPAAVQDRLGAGQYESADEVYAAVEQARGELAVLSAAGVVQLGGRPPRGGSAGIQVRDPLDEARGLVGFFFGAADAPTPPPNLRSFADLYVALTGDAYFRGVFDGDRVQFSGATTSTLPNLAVDAMNRVIVQQFAALDHYRWYERISDVAPNDGRLHAMKWITLGGVGNLPTVNEGAAYTELSIADVKETSSFVKRGGYVGITREMIKNGDIMQLQAIPRALAAAAVRTRSAAVAGLFTSNSGVGPTLSTDSKALFHADHSNLATTALGADAAAWRAARAECFQQPEVGTAKPLGIFPRFLLLPAELYDTALSILGYGEGMPTAYAPEAQGRGFADPRPIPLVVPDWTDATDWAYIVDPALFPVIQMSYSQSPGGRRHPIPELFAVVSETSGLMFSNDVLPIKVRDEFAVGVNGPRGIGKRNVA